MLCWIKRIPSGIGLLILGGLVCATLLLMSIDPWGATFETGYNGEPEGLFTVAKRAAGSTPGVGGATITEYIVLEASKVEGTTVLSGEPVFLTEIHMASGITHEVDIWFATAEDCYEWAATGYKKTVVPAP